MKYRSCLLLVTVAVSAGCSREPVYDFFVKGGNVERGRAALVKYECGACHVIPGIPGAVGQVGPPLESYGRHVYIAGKFPNTPEVLVRWIPDAPSMAPETGMPAIAMTEAESRDMAAYLFSLE